MGQFNLVECQAIEFALQDVFAEFGVEDVSVIPGHGYAFMRVRNLPICVFLFVAVCTVRIYVCHKTTMRHTYIRHKCFLIVFISSNIFTHKKQLSDPKKVAPSIEELNGATIVLTAEAAAGAELQEKEDEGSTLEITPMVL